MFDEAKFLAELMAGVRDAVRVMRRDRPDVEVYSISIWTDVDAMRSAVAFDTFANSEAKRREANATRQAIRQGFLAEGDLRRASLVPADMSRNTNPADFEFRRVVVIENESLAGSVPLDAAGWQLLERLMNRVRDAAARECSDLKLHPQAELGVSGRNTWYHQTIHVPGPP